MKHMSLLFLFSVTLLSSCEFFPARFEIHLDIRLLDYDFLTIDRVKLSYVELGKLVEKELLLDEVFLLDSFRNSTMLMLEFLDSELLPMGAYYPYDLDAGFLSFSFEKGTLAAFYFREFDHLLYKEYINWNYLYERLVSRSNGNLWRCDFHELKAQLNLGNFHYTDIKLSKEIEVSLLDLTDFLPANPCLPRPEHIERLPQGRYIFYEKNGAKHVVYVYDRAYHLLKTSSAKPRKSLTSSFVPSSNTAYPVNRPKTWC